MVLEPTAVVALETQRVVAPGAGENPGSDDAQWSDTIPKLLHARIVQSFENANYLSAVARPMEGFTGDYQLATDIRSFQVSNVPAPVEKLPIGAMAHVAFAAKILGDNGWIVLDDAGKLVGMVSEGDLLRRGESDTEHERSWVAEAADGPGTPCRRISQGTQPQGGPMS